ncbi:amidohydrolase family protein [Bdellovibrio sp. 22V]|uniref:amidohydrolase family protein n=1 Tax=Bdellovibrio TaxID=958 RepID=UPI002542AC39|nr:amidohydrolase family protein [Bdellovibrio sp. 22V]WII70736.1 amidohydrolase family protein [Bdellovibrio sp. 22V]
MMTYLENGHIFVEGAFKKANLLIARSKIERIGNVSVQTLDELQVEVLDCSGCYIIPGLIDPHLHLTGGSGERGGFSSQSLGILVSECVEGGVTTLVGTIGVDTTTKTMPELIAKAKAFNDIGLNAFCYTGGYDCPPRTITDSVRNDIIYIPEVIGVGELAIADRRAPEPELRDLARAVVDAYVGGMLANKPGIAHIHVGPGQRRLQTIRDLMEQHEVIPAKIYMTHIGRSQALVEEAIDLAKKGCFIDFDLWERDFCYWYKIYKDLGGPLSQVTVSSDAGIGKPSELWEELRSGVLQHGLSLEELIPHFTSHPARALELSQKGRILVGCDADLAIFDVKELAMKHVISRGQIFVKDGKYITGEDFRISRRGFDIYGIRKKG